MSTFSLSYEQINEILIKSNSPRKVILQSHSLHAAKTLINSRKLKPFITFQDVYTGSTLLVYNYMPPILSDDLWQYFALEFTFHLNKFLKAKLSYVTGITSSQFKLIHQDYRCQNFTLYRGYLVICPGYHQIMKLSESLNNAMLHDKLV